MRSITALFFLAVVVTALFKFAAGWDLSSHKFSPSLLWSGMEDVVSLIQKELAKGWRSLVKNVYRQPYLYVAMSLTLALELYIPARPRQKLFSVSLFNDYLWFISNSVLKWSLIAALYNYLNYSYDTYLAGLTIQTIALWPTPLRVVISLLVFDLALWIGHWLRHKVRWFWYFHLIHHSQKDLNFFTEDRFHIAEGIMSLVVRFIPMRMVGMGFQEIFILTLVMEWYTRVYHANLKTNYGFLKYFLVTPQAHRIHHSVQPQHWGKNLGTYFIFWDRLFGTHYPHYDEYPETGIPDEAFPCEISANPAVFMRTYFLQFIYPFRLCFRNDCESPKEAS